MPLNNEIDIVTVGGVDQDIKDRYTRAALADTESLTVATKYHRANTVFFSNVDRKLYRCLVDIEIGVTFVPGVNVEERDIGSMMAEIYAQSPEGVMHILGNYEKTDYASKTYHISEMLIWKDGLLYRVVSEIDIGSEIIPDENVILADDDFADLIYKLENDKDGKIVLTQRLSGGETSLTFTHASINNNSLLEVFTETYGVNPLTVTQSGTSVTMTFKAQAQSMTVKLVIREE